MKVNPWQEVSPILEGVDEVACNSQLASALLICNCSPLPMTFGRPKQARQIPIQPALDSGVFKKKVVGGPIENSAVGPTLQVIVILVVIIVIIVIITSDTEKEGDISFVFQKNSAFNGSF